MITFEYYIFGFFFVSVALFTSVFDLDFWLNFFNGNKADEYKLKGFAKWKILKSFFYGFLVLLQLINEITAVPLTVTIAHTD